jgi:Leucine-rich repeat (LRR) protein
VRKNSNFHLLKEAYQQILNESSLPPVGPGVCYFETDKILKRHSDVGVDTSTGKWAFIEKDGKPGGIMSIDENGKPSGVITNLSLSYCRLTSFNGSGLSDLTHLRLNSNQLSSFSGSGLSSLTSLFIGGNQLTSFDGSGLSSLTSIYLDNNRLTSFDGTKSKKLTIVHISYNPFHNINGPAVKLPDGTREYWVDGKKYKDEHDYKVARAKYLRPQDAAKVMKDAADKLGISDMEDLFKDI